MTGPPTELSTTEMLSRLRARLWAGRRLIGTTGLVAGIAATLVMLVVPESYRARTTLLPPRAEGSLGLAAAVLAQSGLENLPGLGGQGSESTDIWIEILRSRTVADRIIDSLGLVHEYGQDRKTREIAMEVARQTLRKRVMARSSFSGVITIDAENRTGLFPRFRPADREHARRLAAALANAFGAELDRANREQAVSRARATRVYYAKELASAREERQKAVKELAQFRRRTGVVPIEAEMQLSLQVAGELKSQLLARRIELGLVRSTDAETSPRVRTLREQITEIERQLHGIDSGIWMEGDSQGDASNPSEDRGLQAYEYGRLIREAKTQEALEDILTQQFYEARMQEGRDLPTVEVLDVAIPPARKHAPVRSRIVLIAGCLGAALGACAVLLGKEGRNTSPGRA